jgi:RNA polymerase sigma factor (sigma-70 family)
MRIMGETLTSIEVKLDDRELLARFVEGRDEQAFSELVARHGRMAQGVCRRILGNSSEADDAFQATFLVLIARAGELHRARGGVRSLGGWLHRVAANAALQVVRESNSRKRRELAFARSRVVSPGESPMQEALPILDEEIRRLPDRYRDPLVLCYFQDQSQHEAADALGISYATLRRRLDQGRELLRNRLSRRGCAIAPALFAAILWDSAAFANDLGPDSAETLATPLLHSTPRTPLGSGGISSRSVSLSRQVLRIMRNQVIRRSVGLLVLLLLLGSTGLVARDVIASDGANGKEAKGHQAKDDPGIPTRRDGSTPAQASKPAAKATSTAPPSVKPQIAPPKEVPASKTQRTTKAPEIDRETAEAPASGPGHTSGAPQGFHGWITINGQTREFDSQEEYEKTLGAIPMPNVNSIEFGFTNQAPASKPNPPKTPKNQARPANPGNQAAPPAPSRKAGAASKKRPVPAKSSRLPAGGARPNNLAQPNPPGFVGFQYEMEFGTGVPGGFVERGFKFGMPGMNGMNGVPGANRTPPAASGGGVDGFDNGVGGPATPEVEGNGRAGGTPANGSPKSKATKSAKPSKPAKPPGD